MPGELSPDGFERVVAAIQRSAREHGQPTLLGRTLTWQAETAGKSRTMLVTVTSRKGETHIRAEERLHQMATGLFVGTTLGGGSGLGLGVGLPVALEVLGSALAAVAIPVAAVGLAYVTAREIYRRIVRRRRAVLAGLVDAVARAASESITEESVALQSPPRPLPGIPP